MKRVFLHPPASATDRRYWRSLDELADTPQFRQWLETEFPQGAAEFHGGEVSRRHFLKIMGASAALAGLAACRRPEKHLVPFTRSVEWAIPGKPLFYATAMPTRNGAVPLVVTTHDGRPTKIEGNPLHPQGRGGTTLFAQTSILDLYDPERSRRFLENGAPTSTARFEAALNAVATQMAGSGGAGLAFLVERNPSPTRERLRHELETRYPQMRWAEYEPVGDDTAREAASIAFGSGVVVRPDFEKADVILALDSDFLGSVEGDLEGIRAFSRRRRVEQAGAQMNRLYVVENRYTITGGMADHRLRLPASAIAVFAAKLAAAVAARSGDTNLDQIAGALLASATDLPLPAGWLEALADDLFAARGRCLVLCGPRQPLVTQLLVLALNTALGSLDQTLHGLPDFTAPAMNIRQLADDIAAGRVSHLFILGGNPAYNAPADLDWSGLQKRVPQVFRLGLHEDETSAGCLWHVPMTHYLEAWGDCRTPDGTYVSVQPMILPLHGGWSDLEVLAALLGRPKPEGPELVRETFRQITGDADSDAAWNKFLHHGFLAGSTPAPRPLAFNADAVLLHLRDRMAPPQVPGPGQFEVVFAADAKMDDGRHANNGWLQELPEPVTKLTWGNAALLSLATARELGLSTLGIKRDLGEKKMGVYDREMITIDFGDGRRLEIPALIAPGHADRSITLPLGYGRTATGVVGRGSGFNAYVLRTTAAPYVAIGASIQRTGRFAKLAITQDHYSMEGRALVRESSLERYNTEHDRDYLRKAGMDAHIPGNVTLYTHPKLDAENQWGMVVDLSLCTGCQACVAACQAENNIPIVGREQVLNGRAMHWIRLDRYFTGEPDDPEMVTQPMMCQHCENAPCETVCPVNATVHSEDGLNVMAYNRCIGTRYCANNCPFKVRRFNFFDYNQRKVIDPDGGPFGGLHKWNLIAEKGMPDTLKMQKNPNVTIRMRGVMEKCTFCVQRIEEARIATKIKAGASDRVRIPPDTFQTACQQACPAEAIVFGDILNPASRVSQLRKQDKNYRLLEYLNLAPRVSYLARLRNPNPKMPDAAHDREGDAPAHHGGHA